MTGARKKSDFLCCGLDIKSYLCPVKINKQEINPLKEYSNYNYFNNMNDKKLMNLAADNIRILAASMVEKANSGHPGGAMGGADFVNVLRVLSIRS